MFLFYTLVIKSKGRCLLLSRHCVNFLSFDPHNHHVNQLFPGLQGRDSALMGPTTRPRPHSQEVEDWDLNSDLSSRGQTASLSQGRIRSPYGFQDSRGATFWSWKRIQLRLLCLFSRLHPSSSQRKLRRLHPPSRLLYVR